MARTTVTPPGRAKRPSESRRPRSEPRYQSSESRSERRRPLPTGAEPEPRLGPYEFRYSIEFGYSSPTLR